LNRAQTAGIRCKYIINIQHYPTAIDCEGTKVNSTTKNRSIMSLKCREPEKRVSCLTELIQLATKPLSDMDFRHLTELTARISSVICGAGIARAVTIVMGPQEKNNYSNAIATNSEIIFLMENAKR
jgi:hypothetical protein